MGRLIRDSDEKKNPKSINICLILLCVYFLLLRKIRDKQAHV